MWIQDGAHWRHAPRWKRIVNGCLRLMQTRKRPARLWVVYTICESDETGPPTVLGYGFGRVTHT